MAEMNQSCASLHRGTSLLFTNLLYSNLKMQFSIAGVFRDLLTRWDLWGVAACFSAIFLDCLNPSDIYICIFSFFGNPKPLTAGISGRRLWCRYYKSQKGRFCGFWNSASLLHWSSYVSVRSGPSSGIQRQGHWSKCKGQITQMESSFYTKSLRVWCSDAMLIASGHNDVSVQTRRLLVLDDDPSGVSVLRSKIQYCFLSFLHFLLLLWSSIFSIPITFRSSREWSGWLKCVATGLSSFFVVMSDRWPFILMCRAFSVSPTYCMLHLSQLIRYTMFFVLHVNWFLMVYLLPMVLLVKVLVRFICAGDTPSGTNLLTSEGSVMSLLSLALDSAVGSGANASVAHPWTARQMFPGSVLSTHTKQAPPESVRWHVHIQQAWSVVGSPRCVLPMFHFLTWDCARPGLRYRNFILNPFPVLFSNS